MDIYEDIELEEFENEVGPEEFVGSALPDAEIARRIGMLSTVDEDGDSEGFLNRVGLGRCDHCDTVTLPSNLQDIDGDKACSDCVDPEDL